MVGILVISHLGIGREMVRAATAMLGICPLQIEVLSIMTDSDPDDMLREARFGIARLNQGEGVLVLTDMYGSTPSNIAAHLLGDQVRVIAGVNLPMLVRVLNYPRLGLDELVNKALSGGRDGVLLCPSGTGG
ncbi:MAG: PTS fructose transporter subunit IIA [Gammaproteobacteria bacterium]|nr:PTS fructose transporter subunit IIA [Gammaproteobacteria bacterium]